MELLKSAGSYALDRLQEASTYAGIAGLLGANFGIHFNPDFQGAVTKLGMCAAATAAILIKEGWKARAAKAEPK
jgi:hypothetical protein